MLPGCRHRRVLVPAGVLAALAAGLVTAAGQPGAGERKATAGVAPAAVSPLTPGFVVKPSDVVLPQDVPIGQYRRSFRPFPNWTLICDENLARRQKVCNIAQTILGPDGTPVLSWSLAANQGGEPLFIIRTPPTLGDKGQIRIDIPDGQPPLAVPVTGCDAKICLAYLPAENRLRAAVAKGQAVGIAYAVGTPPVLMSFKAPFDGLSAALAGL